MALVAMYDEEAIKRLAADLASEIVLVGAGPSDHYQRLARKMYKQGWRNVEETPAVTVAVPVAQHTRSQGSTERKRGWLVWSIEDGQVRCRGFARDDSSAAERPAHRFPDAKVICGELVLMNKQFGELAKHEAGLVHDHTCAG